MPSNEHAAHVEGYETAKRTGRECLQPGQHNHMLFPASIRSLSVGGPHQKSAVPPT